MRRRLYVFIMGHKSDNIQIERYIDGTKSIYTTPSMMDIPVAKIVKIVALFVFVPFLIFAAIRVNSPRFLIVSRNKHPSFYISEVPDAYINSCFGEDNTNRHYGYAALGPLLAPEHDHWDSIWYQVSAWYIDQMRTSFLRTYDIDAADIIFVPATVGCNNIIQNDFIANASYFLPYLGQKPHVVVLTHAPSWYSGMLSHENSANFVFISWGQLNKSDVHVIGSPAFSHVHWSRGSMQMRHEGKIFDPNRIKQSKKMLVVGSFVVRDYPDRIAAHKDCLEKPNLCKYVEYNGPQDAVAVYEAYKSAWYALHPRGDFLSRNSWFDTWLADTIPVVFQSEYINSVPFGDMLDYKKLMIYVPEERILGNESENIVSILKETFDEGDALQRTSYIHSVRHVFQYMLNPVHELIRWDQRARLHQDDDAFTFTMKSVLKNVCSRGWCSQQCALV